MDTAATTMRTPAIIGGEDDDYEFVGSTTLKLVQDDESPKGSMHETPVVVEDAYPCPGTTRPPPLRRIVIPPNQPTSTLLPPVDLQPLPTPAPLTMMRPPTVDSGLVPLTAPIVIPPLSSSHRSDSSTSSVSAGPITGSHSTSGSSIDNKALSSAVGKSLHDDGSLATSRNQDLIRTVNDIVVPSSGPPQLPPSSSSGVGSMPLLNQTEPGLSSSASGSSSSAASFWKPKWMECDCGKCKHCMAGMTCKCIIL